MRNTHYTALMMAVVAANGLDKLHMLIPDAPSVEEMPESSPTVAEATYNLRVHKAEYVAQPKSVTAKGPYLKVQWVITGPATLSMGGQTVENKAVGRMVFMNYSLTGDGSFRLRELLTITGHDASFKLQDSDQLLGLECAAAVVVQKGTGGYSDKNEIRKHLPLLVTA